MGECAICYEIIYSKYRMTGCSHTICAECAKECKDRSTINSITVDGNFPFYTGDIYQPISCPLCRQVENKMTPEEFKQYYPEKYDEWIQLELNCSPNGFSYYITYEENIYPKTSRMKTYTKYENRSRIPKPITWKRKTIPRKGKRKI